MGVWVDLGVRACWGRWYMQVDGMIAVKRINFCCHYLVRHIPKHCPHPQRCRLLSWPVAKLITFSMLVIYDSRVVVTRTLCILRPGWGHWCGWKSKRLVSKRCETSKCKTFYLLGLLNSLSNVLLNGQPWPLFIYSCYFKQFLTGKNCMLKRGGGIPGWSQSSQKNI